MTKKKSDDPFENSTNPLACAEAGKLAGMVAGFPCYDKRGVACLLLLCTAFANEDDSNVRGGMLIEIEKALAVSLPSFDGARDEDLREQLAQLRKGVA
jgi:hypothetical protein